MLQTIKDAWALLAFRAERHPWSFVCVDPTFRLFRQWLLRRGWVTRRREDRMGGRDRRRPSCDSMGWGSCRPDTSTQPQCGTSLRTCNGRPLQHVRGLRSRTRWSSRCSKLRRAIRPPVWFHSCQSLGFGSRNLDLANDCGDCPNNEASQEYKENYRDQPERARVRFDDRLRF